MSSKAKSVPPPVQTQNSMVSAQTAVYLLNNKIQKIEEVMKLHMDDIETKFGEHEAYVTDNIPDLDLINKAISEINTRLIDLESLEARVAALEGGKPVSSTSPVVPQLASPPAPPKKKGTVKLNDITPTPVVGVEPGISFS